MNELQLAGLIIFSIASIILFGVVKVIDKFEKSLNKK